MLRDPGTSGSSSRSSPGHRIVASVPLGTIIESARRAVAAGLCRPGPVGALLTEPDPACRHHGVAVSVAAGRRWVYQGLPHGHRRRGGGLPLRGLSSESRYGFRRTGHDHGHRRRGEVYHCVGRLSPDTVSAGLANDHAHRRRGAVYHRCVACRLSPDTVSPPDWPEAYRMGAGRTLDWPPGLG